MKQPRPRLGGNVAIVTDAESGGPDFSTGRATSILSTREGARVLLVDRVSGHAEENLA